MVFSGLFQSFDDIWNPPCFFETNVERDCSSRLFAYIFFEKVKPPQSSFPKVSKHSTMRPVAGWRPLAREWKSAQYLTACRWGGGGQVSWVTNSLWSLKDKLLNKITSVKMCHTATSVPPRCHMTGSPSGDPAAHQLGLCCRDLSVPAANNAPFTVGGNVTTEKNLHQVRAASTKTSILLYPR